MASGGAGSDNGPKHSIPGCVCHLQLACIKLYRVFWWFDMIIYTILTIDCFANSLHINRPLEVYRRRRKLRSDTNSWWYSFRSISRFWVDWLLCNVHIIYLLLLVKYDRHSVKILAKFIKLYSLHRKIFSALVLNLRVITKINLC